MFYEKNNKSNYHVAIIGAGSIGITLTSCIQDFSLCMLFNSSGIVPIDIKYLLISKNGVKKEIFPSYFDFKELDCVFVCTKIYNIEKALNSYIDKIPYNCPIILCCNGYILDLVKKFYSLYPKHSFRISYMDCGVSKIEKFTYRINSFESSFIWGPANIPSLNSNEKKIFDFEKKLNGYQDDFSSIKFSLSDAALAKNSTKWIFNTCLNSLCSYKSCLTNGEVLKYQKELHDLFCETYTLSGLIFKNVLLESKDTIFQKLLFLIESTFSNPNSMVCDLLNHRPTENNYLAGLSCIDPKSFQLLHKIYLYIKKLELK